MEGGSSSSGHGGRLAGVAMPATRQCEVCGAIEGGDRQLLLCTGCREVRYCGRACQKQHWKQHKAVCKRADKE
jgi:hypothetical protein